MGAIFRITLAGLILGLVLPVNLQAQCPTEPRKGIVANPNRPTVADPADISELGVVEIESGYERDWYPGHIHGNAPASLLKFAVACNLEIRWSPGMYMSQGDQQSYGDNWIGAQYRFRRAKGKFPTLAASYALKIPSADSTNGLGSGRADHQIKFLASKDMWGTHFDFNASEFIIGRPNQSGHDHNAEIDLSFSHGLRGKLGLTSEIYHDTRLNQKLPGFTSALWALTYAITPRLVVDAGFDHALTSGAPTTRRMVMGVVYSIAEVYPRIRPRRAIP